MSYKRIAYHPSGRQEVLETSVIPPGFVGNLKVWYGKIIVVLTSFLAVVNELTPVLNFLPGQDKHYVTAALSFVAGAVALLKKYQAWVNSV
jgi:hypothetical protein